MTDLASSNEKGPQVLCDISRLRNQIFYVMGRKWCLCLQMEEEQDRAVGDHRQGLGPSRNINVSWNNGIDVRKESSDDNYIL